ncbi:hypothetical protein [Flavobacterium sp. SM2513]|uniref:hypothetical protein n=1 Tax=Flavobacterium sp. SM2513 TaxID=3424766 RepID=UPI003D7F8DD7
MKKQVINYETNSWACYEIKNLFEVLEAFMTYAHIDHYKQMLSDAVLYAQKNEVYNKEEPGQLFMCHAVLRSFFRACSKLESMSKKWKVQQTNTECKSVLHQASLNEEEYNNPFMVFKNAFAENSVKDYEYFFSTMVEMALSHHQLDYDPDLFNFYIHTVKMLDASQLIRERGLEKSKKETAPAEVVQQETNPVGEEDNETNTTDCNPVNQSEPLPEHQEAEAEPQNNQNQITTIITKTLSTCGIYCFGERKTNKAHESLYSERKESTTTLYYLLVIVPTMPQNIIADLAFLINTQTKGRCTATLLIHTLRDLRRDKTKQASFFQKIVFEGVTWFENWQNTPPLKLDSVAKRKCKEIESYWMDRKMIVDGWRDAAVALDSNDAEMLKITFLHQTVEQLCLGLIHTFLGYRPHHFALGYLLELCDLFTPIASELFPRKTKQELAFLKPLFRSINDRRHFKTIGKTTPQLPLLEERCTAFYEQATRGVDTELQRLKSVE